MANHRTISSVLSLCLSCWLASDSQALAKTIGRIQVTPTDRVIVGQRVTVAIDVLTDEGWAKLSRKPQIELPGTLTFVPPSGSARISDNIAGESFTGSRTEIWLFPLQPGKLTIPPMEVEASAQTFGASSEEQAQTLMLEGLSVTVRQPEFTLPQASAQPARIPVTDRLEVSQIWSKFPEQFCVGDGVTRTLVQEANGIPALLLEPIPFVKVPGAEVTKREPESDNQFNRGTLTSSRTDAATYLFTEPGPIRLPSVEIYWIDPADGQLHKKTMEGKDFEVITKSDNRQGIAGPPPTAEERWGPLQLAGFVVALLLSATAVYFAYQHFANKHTVSPKHKKSERDAFRELQSTARDEDPDKLLAAVYAWAFQVVPRDESVHAWLALHAGTSRHLESLEQSAASNTRFSDAPALIRTISLARRKHRQITHRHAQASPLPPLRPHKRVT
ncbi:MAG TPA: hypothetical protein DDW52_09380 [Planctomycetaceae bacterium]|nr:hypothetical protein [Planctomycetaceae bacterium]